MSGTEPGSSVVAGASRRELWEEDFLVLGGGTGLVDIPAWLDKGLVPLSLLVLGRNDCEFSCLCTHQHKEQLDFLAILTCARAQGAGGKYKRNNLYTKTMLQYMNNSYLYRVSQEEWTKLQESVPYVELYRYNPKHLYPKSNGFGDNGQRSLKLWQLLHTYWLPNTY